MDFIYDDISQSAEKSAHGIRFIDEQRFDGLRRDEDNTGWIGNQVLFVSPICFAVPPGHWNIQVLAQSSTRTN